MTEYTASKPNFLELTADIVSAFVSNNALPVSELPGLISSVHSKLSNLGNPASEITTSTAALVPAVPIKKSVGESDIACLECGRRFKSLKRHLASHHSLTPDEYRVKWSLQPSYPIVAPAYAAARSELAKTIGLGRKPKQLAETETAPE